jgi:hypothetical protein
MVGAMMNFVNFVTSKKGVFAAILAVATFISILMGIFRPFIQERKENIKAKAKLEITKPILTSPSDGTTTGEFRFELMNAGSSNAVLRSLKLLVTDHSPSRTLKMIIPEAPIPVHTFRVELNPKEFEYELFSHVYSDASPPRSFSKGEVEAFIVRISSSESQWYRFKLIIEWYDVQEPKEINFLYTDEQELDFPPDIRELLK